MASVRSFLDGVVLLYSCVHLPTPSLLERTPSSGRLTVLVVPTTTVRRPTGAINNNALIVETPNALVKVSMGGGMLMRAVCVLLRVIQIPSLTNSRYFVYIVSSFHFASHSRKCSSTFKVLCTLDASALFARSEHFALISMVALFLYCMHLR